MARLQSTCSRKNCSKNSDSKIVFRLEKPVHHIDKEIEIYAYVWCIIWFLHCPKYVLEIKYTPVVLEIQAVQAKPLRPMSIKSHFEFSQA